VLCRGDGKGEGYREEVGEGCYVWGEGEWWEEMEEGAREAVRGGGGEEELGCHSY
jgi:hypothetical protein